MSVNPRSQWALRHGRALFTLSLLAAWACAQAQGPASQAAGVIHLSATATQEVPMDQLSVVFSTQKEGPDPAPVQAQLKLALEAALAEARKAVRPGQLEAQTGAFGLHPRYAPKGGVNGWVGQAELLVQGRDAAAVAALVGRIQSMSVARVGWSLSREAREKAEAEVSSQAITRWRQKAEAHARQFGGAGYQLREVTVSGGDVQPPRPLPMARGPVAAMASALPSEALPTEGGKEVVSVSVSGSLQMK